MVKEKPEELDSLNEPVLSLMLLLMLFRVFAIKLLIVFPIDAYESLDIPLVDHDQDVSTYIEAETDELNDKVAEVPLVKDVLIVSSSIIVTD